MGFDKSRFRESDLKEPYFCPICKEVLEDPVQIPICGHNFCRECIAAWFSIDKTCPIDKKRITPKGLKAVPRRLKSLLSNLEISCDFASKGCQAIVKMNKLEGHIKESHFSPKSLMKCEEDCDSSRKRKETGAHSCLLYLKRVNKELEVKLQLNEVQFKEEKEEMTEESTKLKDEVRALREEAEGVATRGQRLTQKRKLVRSVDSREGGPSSSQIIKEKMRKFDPVKEGMKEGQKSSQEIMETLKIEIETLREEPEGQSSSRMRITTESLGKGAEDVSGNKGQGAFYESRGLRINFFGSHPCSLLSLKITPRALTFHSVPSYSDPKLVATLMIPFNHLVKVEALFQGPVTLLHVKTYEEVTRYVKWAIGSNEANSEYEISSEKTLPENGIIIELKEDISVESKALIRALFKVCPSLRFEEVSSFKFFRQLFTASSWAKMMLEK